MPENSQDRVVRVFVSSTFRDMFAEREELVKFTFPEIRRRCRERGVEFVDVDLRWGVTEEQSERGEVLPICLAEIERCHPYFIGLLGERYGWVPDEIDQEIIDSQPWLEEHKEKSVTELEILHGVIENKEMEKRSYFYLRDANTSRRIEAALSKEPDYQPEPEHYQKKRDSLKERIRDYPYRNYSDVKILGRQVLNDLWAAIDKQFPESEAPTLLEQERLEHEAFAAVRRNVYIGKQKYFDRIDEHVKSDGQPLVILGDSGSGKSALVANWAKDYQEKHPNDFMLLHFVGSSADSADYVKLLRRIILEIKARTEPEKIAMKGSSANVVAFKQRDDKEDIPDNPQRLIEVFPLWLAKAAAKGRFILILDGLNQLEDRDNASDLIWLPQKIPPQVRLIISTLPGPSLRSLQVRGWTSLGVDLLDTREGDTEERRNLIIEYLRQFSKTLDEHQIERIIKATQTKNPLYLKTLLDELRVFGSHEKLDKRIEYYLQTNTIDALFDRMLERLEQDYERDRPGLTQEIMSLIWASRRGLSEIELLELVDIPQAVWSPLRLAVEESLVSRSGLWNFFHDFLGQAIQQRYLNDLKCQQRVHLRIADYFFRSELGQRKIEELPWQLQHAESWERLKDCITEPAMFLKCLSDEKRIELTGYWRSIGSRFDMEQSYKTAIEKYERSRPTLSKLVLLLDQIGSFLELNGKLEGSEPLYRRSLEITENAHGPEHPINSFGLSRLANLLHETNRYSEAEPLCRRALAMAESVWGSEHPMVAAEINNLASLLNDTNRHSEAESLFRRALEIREAAIGPDHPGVAPELTNLAGLLLDAKRYSEAEALYRRALENCEAAFGLDHPDLTSRLGGLASLLNATERYSEAELLFRRALKIYETAYGSSSRFYATGLHNLAALMYSCNAYAEAERLCRQALEINEAVYGPDHTKVANGLNSLAANLTATGRHSEAEALYRRSLEIYETAYGPDHPSVATGLNNLASLLYANDRHSEAESLHRQALGINEAAYGPDHAKIAGDLNSLADVLTATGRHGEAEALYRRSLEINRTTYGPDHPSVAIGLNSLASLLNASDRHSEAESLYRQALGIDEAAYGSDHAKVADGLNSLAAVLTTTGCHSEAESLYRRALKIYENYDPFLPHVAVVLDGLASLLAATNRTAEAEPLFCRALEINEAIYGPDHPEVATGLNNLASFLDTLNRHAEAEPLFRRALEIYEVTYGPSHPYVAIGLNNLAKLLHTANRPTEAEPLFCRALEINEAVFGSVHPNLVMGLSDLGRLMFAAQHYEKAATYFSRAMKICLNCYGSDHPWTKAVSESLGACRVIIK